MWLLAATPQHPASASRVAERLDIIVKCSRVETGHESVHALLHFPFVGIERFRDLETPRRVWLAGARATAPWKFLYGQCAVLRKAAVVNAHVRLTLCISPI